MTERECVFRGVVLLFSFFGCSDLGSRECGVCMCACSDSDSDSAHSLSHRVCHPCECVPIDTRPTNTVLSKNCRLLASVGAPVFW